MKCIVKIVEHIRRTVAAQTATVERGCIPIPKRMVQSDLAAVTLPANIN